MSPSLMYLSFFQFTTSHGGRHDLTIEQIDTVFFQFTTSHGGRQYLCKYTRLYLNLSIHDLTRRSTHNAIASLFKSSFQFTTSHGGRRLLSADPQKLYTFNSRPHTEVDPTEAAKNCYEICLSIHDLTRRSTKLPILLYMLG